MTVNGVAIATVISNAISSVLLFIKLRRTNGIIHLEAKELKIDSASLKNILRIGLPAGIQSAVFAVSNIVIQSAINSLGTVVMAASSAAYNIEIITYDILNSFSQACTTFVGQNVGAGEMKRCRRTLFLCLAEGIVTLSLAVALILLFGKTLLAFFNRDPEVVETRHIRLMMVMLSHTFSLFYEVMAGYLRGFGIIYTSGCADYSWRVRSENSVDRACVPEVSDVPLYYDGIPDKSLGDRTDDIDRASHMSSRRPRKQSE